MDGWEAIRKAARDRRSGAAEIAAAAARGVETLGPRREVLRAARLLLRAHPAMAPLWQLLAGALAHEPGKAARTFAERLAQETDGTAHAAAWLFRSRKTVVLTHSASSSVLATLRVARKRVSLVLCTESDPGGEGKSFARRLARDGFDTETVADSAMIVAASRADIVITGADAVTEEGAVNKIGTYLLALAAREAGAPCYVIAGTTKLVPDDVWRRVTAPLYDQTPLDLVDGVVTERGVLSPAAVRRAVRKVRVPDELMGALR
jgi:translation initiation factor eIF-2B subunit delta